MSMSVPFVCSTKHLVNHSIWKMMPFHSGKCSRIILIMSSSPALVSFWNSYYLDAELPALFQFSHVFPPILCTLIFVHYFLGGLCLTASSAIIYFKCPRTLFCSLNVPLLQLYVLIQWRQFLLLPLWGY